jgi:HlyD family secretion protein
MVMKSIKTLLFLSLALMVQISCTDRNNLSDAYGNFEVDEVIISSEANGRLILFLATEGKALGENELVAIIDTTNLSLQRHQLQAQSRAVASKIENIEAQIKVQEQQKKNLLVDRKRVKNLMKDGAATQKQLDDINGAIELVDSQIASIKTQYTSVKTELEVVKTQVAQVEESVSKCRISNPLKGIVLEKYAEQNEVTTFGRPLYKIADMNEMILRVYVSGAQLPGIQLGQQVEVLIDEDEKENRSLQGEVSWISETAEFTPKIIQTKEERVNMVYAVKIRVKNDGSLKIGMPGEANF